MTMTTEPTTTEPTTTQPSAGDATAGVGTARRTGAGSGRRRHSAGAPLLPPVLSYAVLTVAAVVVPLTMAGEGPWQSDHVLLDFFRGHAAAAHASAFLTLGAAIPLAVLSVVATSRVRTLGVDVPGRMIALAGGLGASVLLAAAGLATLAITQPHVADSAAAVRALYGLTYALGGPGFAGFLGLLLAGLGIVGLMTGVLPRPVAATGVALAVVCEVATVSAAVSGLSVLLPVARFGGLIWLVAMGVTLPADRRDLRARRGVERAADRA